MGMKGILTGLLLVVVVGGCAVISGLCLIAVTGGCAVIFAPRSGGEQEPSRLIVRRLVHVTPGEYKKVISLHVGDMLQIEPFELPATPKYLNATLQMHTEGARALELIGQSMATSNPDGQTGRSAFFRALGLGRTTVHVALTDRSNRVIEDYQAIYRVDVGTPK